jgi:hypothetical protein
MLQPGNPGDNRDYYELQIDVNGAIWDTHFDDYNAPIVQGPGGQRFGHQEWIARVQRAVVVHRAAGRYSVEIAWPWSSLVRARTPSPAAPGRPLAHQPVQLPRRSARRDGVVADTRAGQLPPLVALGPRPIRRRGLRRALRGRSLTNFGFSVGLGVEFP